MFLMIHGPNIAFIGVRGWSLTGYFIPGHVGWGGRASWDCSAAAVAAAAALPGPRSMGPPGPMRSEEHTSELQSQ